MPTHHDDLELVIGDEWFIVGLLLDSDGKPIDTSTAQLGWTLCGSDGNQVSGLADTATLEPQPDGIVNITLPADVTRTLQVGRYLDAIRVTVDGSAMTEWVGIINADANPFHGVLGGGE